MQPEVLALRAVGHDQAELGPLLHRKIDDGLRQLKLDRVVVDGLDAFRIHDGRQLRLRTRRRRGIEQALERIDHVLGAEILAIVKLDALAQMKSPYGAI